MLKAVGRMFKSDTSMWILVAVVVLVLIWALFSYSGSKTKVRDTMIGGGSSSASSSIPSQTASPLAMSSQSVTGGNSTMATMPPPPSGGGAVARPTLQPSDIVLNAVNMPDLIMSPQAFIGIDTISNTLKNPSYDFRSDPIIPKVNVGPWNNSTIDPDLARVPLELGQGQR